MRTPTPWSWTRSLARGAVLCSLVMLPALTEAQNASGSTTASNAKLSQREADRRARDRFEKGRAAFSNGSYRDAWEHFREAYLLSKRPELLYNVGQSADRMRMDREALKAFKLYLEKLPNAPNRREVEARVAFLEENLHRETTGSEPTPTTLDDSTGNDPTLPAEGEVGRPPAPEPLSDGPEDSVDEIGNASLSDDDGDSDGVDSGEAPDAKTEDGQPTRSGWYVRVALGLGILADSLSDTQAESLGSTTLSGMALLGHDLANGAFVLGGGVMFDGGLSPSVRVGQAKRDFDTANLGVLVAFIDYYLAPRQHGWHLLGGLGVGTLSLTDKTASVGIEDATGGSLMVGGGCEWKIDRAWGIGGLARLVVSRLSTDVAQHTAFAPSVAVTAAWY